MTDSRWKQTFGDNPLVVMGVIHLGACPGSPNWGGDMEEVVQTALEDARILEELGADAIMVENFNDSPFFRDRADPGTVAAMGAVGREISKATELPLGYQVLRNDAFASLALCAAGRGSFIRANIFTDAMVTDQGLVQANAAEATRYRRLLDSDAMFIADIYSKHAAPLARRPLDVVAKDAGARGKASGLIVSGFDSPTPPTMEDLRTVVEAVPETPIVLGSGTPATLIEHCKLAQGVIIPSPRTYGAPTWSLDGEDGDDAYAAAEQWMRTVRAGVTA